LPALAPQIVANGNLGHDPHRRAKGFGLKPELVPLLPAQANLA
jgi:hypothetical protein